MSDKNAEEEEAVTPERGTVYVVVHAKWNTGDISGSLLRDTGEVPWSHMSSSEGWLIRDLTAAFSDRRDQLDAWYPNGYDVVLVDREGVVPQEVLDRNEAWKAASDQAAGVSSE